MGTLTLMYRRHQISHPEYQAGLRYRRAWEAIRGSTRSTVDLALERVQAGPTSRMPAAIMAAEHINQVQRCLGPIDHGILFDVVVFGRTIAEATAAMGIFGISPTDKDREHVGRRFRIALGRLAEEFGIANPMG